MIAIVEQVDLIGKLIGRKGVQTFNLGAPLPVGQKTEYVGDDDGVVKSSIDRIGLSDNDNACSLFCLEQPLHCSKLGGLVNRDLSSLQIAAREELDRTGYQSDDDSQRYEDAAIIDVDF